MDSQFNFAPIRVDQADVANFPAMLRFMNTQFQRIGLALRGPVAQALGIQTGSCTVDLTLADLTTITVTGNLVITLDVSKKRAGRRARLELTQDATGAHTVTFVNALGTIVVSTTANQRTLIDLTDNGAAWIGAVLASNY